MGTGLVGDAEGSAFEPIYARNNLVSPKVVPSPWCSHMATLGDLPPGISDDLLIDLGLTASSQLLEDD